MSKINLYSEKTKTQVDLPKDLSEPASESLLAQAEHVYRARAHKSLAYAKTRAEVSITKKKIYRQKGTGGARHGAKSAPIFVGGGVTHGPTGKSRVLSLPQTLKQKAAKGAMDIKAKEGRVAAIKGLTEFSKTNDAAKIINQVQKDVVGKIGGTTLIVLPDGKVNKALRNIKNSQVVGKSSLNAHVLLSSAVIIFDASLVEAKKATKQNKK